MFKYTIAIFAIIACAAAKPGLIGAPLAYTAPVIAAAPAPFVTATSSQVIARNYNGIATAPVIAPVASPVIAAPITAAYTARYAAASPLAYTAPLAYSAPINAAYTARYAAATPFAYSAPLAYSTPFAAPSPVLF